MGRKVSTSMNPFLASFQIKVRRKTTIRRSLESLDDESNTILGEQTFYNEVEIDEFTKLYHVQYSSGLLKELTPMGTKLLLYILFHLKQEEDWIRLKQSELMSELDISESSTLKGLKNLMENGIIAKRPTQSEYWINPQVLFAGDRKSYAKRSGDDKIQIIADRKPTLVDVTESPAKNGVIYSLK